MKAKTFGIFVAAFFIFAGTAALADNRGGRFEGARDSDGWSLGERVRGGYAIYHRGHRVPGSAIAIADGWVLGTKREIGGYAIYRWNGRGWDQAPGGAVDIGGSYRRPWVVNNRGQSFTWNGFDWEASYGSIRGNAFKRDSRGHDSYGRHGYTDRHGKESGWSVFGRYYEDKRHGRSFYDRDRDRHRHDRGRDRDRSERRSTRW